MDSQELSVGVELTEGRKKLKEKYISQIKRSGKKSQNGHRHGGPWSWRAPRTGHSVAYGPRPLSVLTGRRARPI